MALIEGDRRRKLGIFFGNLLGDITGSDCSEFLRVESQLFEAQTLGGSIYPRGKHAESKSFSRIISLWTFNSSRERTTVRLVHIISNVFSLNDASLSSVGSHFILKVESAASEGEIL